jgi:hypothetical protein
MKQTLKTRIINIMMHEYYHLLEMDDYADMYEFIYEEDERDYELTLSQVAEIVENHMTILKETIDEAQEKLQD